MSDQFSGINDEYELTEWEVEDIYWIREGVSSYRSRLSIDPIEADALMENRLIGAPLTDQQVRDKIIDKLKEIRHGSY